MAFRALRTAGLTLGLGLSALAAYQGVRNAMADPPSHQRAALTHLDATGDREVVYCHQCSNEWWRDEQGLICPRCEGEATEIVSILKPYACASPALTKSFKISPENDPRDMRDAAVPDEIRNLQAHDPWARNDVPDPEDGDVEEYVTHGPNSTMFYSSRIIRPRRRAAEGDPSVPDASDPNNVIRDFQNMIGDFMGPGMQQGQAGRSGPDTLFRTVDDDDLFFRPLGSGGNVRHERPGGPRARPNIASGRFTFTATTGPRNADGPQPMAPPVEELATYAPPPLNRSRSGPNVLIISIRARPDQLIRILGGLFGAMGPLAEARNAGENQNGQQNGLPQGLQGFIASIFNPAGAVSGDAVYTQEALDRIISQLMEQHPTSNAPGPAPAEAIASLPKKKLDEKMLGSDIKADCSVCMDDVFQGDEVVVLPCNHWFHEACAAAWLSEHNTCPICRKGITDNVVSSGSRPTNPIDTSNASNAPASDNDNHHPPSPPSPGAAARREALHQRSMERNEARLQAIRAAARLDSTPENEAQNYHNLGNTSRSEPPSPPPIPGAYESSRHGPLSRRASSISDTQQERRLSRSGSSRGSIGSSTGNGNGSSSNNSGGPISWFRRFSGGGGDNRRQD